MDIDDEKLLHRLQAKAEQARQKLGEQQPRQLPARRTKPTASDASGGLGCLTGSPVILQSGQLARTCKHQDVVLEGAIDIELHLTYVSDQHYRGYFGYNRRFRYEQQLRQPEDAPNTWRLYLHNGREFDFTETPDGFNNPGDFPASLSRTDEHTLVLDYFDGRPQETYRDGNLVRMQDRHGNALLLSHRADNALTRIESSSGAFIELDYNANKRVESLKDHAGRTWHYRYDQHDNLTAIINPLGESESYQYRAIERADAPHNHLLETIHDATDHAWLEAEYDAQGRVIAYREGSERYRYHYVHNQLIEKTDAHDRTTVYSLDDYSLVYAITHPDGRYECEDYDPTARVAKITNGGHTYEEHYDARHRLALVDHGFGEIEEYAYSGGNPAPTSVTKDGQTSTHTYDGRDNLIATTTPDGATEHYAWDERGNLTGHTDGEGHTTAFAYDEQDQIIQVTDPAGHSHQFAYNAQGQQTRHTDPLGQTETFEYDLLGRPTGHTNTLGQNLSLTYTTQGRVSQLVDPAGKSTEWRYNAQGQLTEQRRPGGHRQRYHYNDDGLIDAIQRADGSELHVAYNAQKRITELTAWPEPEASDQNGQRQTYHYNDNGRLTEAHNGAHHLQQDYADQGKLGTSTQDGIDIDTWYNNGHGGDKLGGVALLGQSWHYQHDLAGQVASAQQGIHKLQQQHNANGQVSERQYPNGLAEHYAYTDNGQLQTLGEQDDKLPPIHYQYNPLGLVAQKNDTEYQYDPLGQLSQTSERPYYHDAVGNPIDNSQSYDAQDRLQSDGQHKYRYDGRGNLVEKQHKETRAKTTYTWNLFDQLVEVNHTDAEGNTEQLQFEYDALNRRVKKSHTQNDQTTTRRYLYQGHNLVAILDGNDQLLATIIHDQAIDTPLAITTYGHKPKPLTEAQQAVWDELGEADRNHLEKSQTERCYYYHRDHQGSITALTDEDGEIVESFEYDAFGNITGHQKKAETHNPFAYTGREFDRHDLYYYRARYYDPTQRRFISADPIGLLSGDFNFYRYVDNDPLNQVDPFGYKKRCLSKGHAKKLTELGKKLGKRLGKAFMKRIATTAASLATGPGAVVVAVANIGLSLWDLWSAKDDIIDLYDTIQEADLDLSAISLTGAMSNIMAGEPPLPDCDKKKTTGETKEKNKVKGKKKKKEKCKSNCPCSCEKKKMKGSKPVLYTGAKALFDEKELDFSINALIPLVWQRGYSSDNPTVGLLGQGWTLPADSHLLIDADKITHADASGRSIEFGLLAVGESEHWPVEQLTLSRPEKSLYKITDGGGYSLVFTPSQIAGRFQLNRLEDRNGNSLRYIYNYFQKGGHEDRLTHIITNDERVFALRYLDQPTYTRLAGVDEWRWADGADRDQSPTTIEALVSYRYSLQGDLVEVKNHTGRITRQFEYKNHILTVHKVPDGLESFYEYDQYTPQGKVIRSWANTGESWTFSYQKQQASITDRSARKTTYYFDKDEYLTGTTDALGQELRIELDNEGLPEKIINEAGQEKAFRYDGRGNPVLIKDFDGTSIQVSYHDDFNLPVEIGDDLGNATTFEYDDKGNLLKETAADGAVTAYEYNERGQPIVITDAKGGKNHLTYDAVGNLIEHTDCSGQTTKYTYDRHSNLTSVTDALQQTISCQYDKEYRVTQVTYPDGSHEKFDYDSQGRLIAYIDPKGQQTRYELDIEGTPIKRIDALGNELEYHYDTSGRLQRLINENKAEYKFAYDPLDRLVEEQGLDGTITRYQYDPVGNVTEKHENTASNNPRITTFERDKTTQLAKKIIQQSESETEVTYQYDELGQLVQTENPQVKIELAYDPLGRLLSEATETADGYQSTLVHEYDLLGNRIQTQLPNGKTLNWLYYGSGHLHQINLDGQVICDYERDALHREIQRTQGKLHSSTQYDPLGRILQQQTLRKNEQDQDAVAPSLNQQGKSPIQLQRNYRYDKAGELSQIDDLRNGTTHYRYDPLGRITQTQQPGLTETFAFDPAHNLIPANEGQPTGYIKDNRLKVYQDKRYDYDAFGNLTEKKIGSHTQMQFQYDLEHQMSEAIVTRNGTTQSYQYAYDPFGRRISKTDAFNTTHFIWDGNRLLSETRGNQTKTYLYEQDGFVPVAQLDDNDPNSQYDHHDPIRYYHTDHLGTPRELTSPEGEVVWETTYTTWGNTVQKSWQIKVPNPNELPDQPLRFQGQYFDAETGLHYNRFRYYDPDVGRFVTQDPIGLLGGENIYRYAPNPIKWVDPLGLEVQINRTMSKLEMCLTVKEKGLVRGKKNSKGAKWVAKGELFDTAKASKYKVVFNMDDSVNDFLDTDVIHDSGSGFPGKESGNMNKILTKSNEPGAYGIGVDKVDEFNNKVKSIEVYEKQKGGKWKKVNSKCN